MGKTGGNKLCGSGLNKKDKTHSPIHKDKHTVQMTAKLQQKGKVKQL